MNIGSPEEAMHPVKDLFMVLSWNLIFKLHYRGVFIEHDLHRMYGGLLSSVAINYWSRTIKD